MRPSIELLQTSRVRPRPDVPRCHAPRLDAPRLAAASRVARVEWFRKVKRISPGRLVRAASAQGEEAGSRSRALISNERT